MGDTGGNGLDACGFERGDDAVGGEARRHVDVADRRAEQAVADDTADEPRVRAATECGDERVELREGQGASRAERLASIAAVAPQIRRSPHRISK